MTIISIFAPIIIVMNQKSSFNLKIDLCNKEEHVFKIHGRDFINSIIDKLSQQRGYKCNCCGYIPSLEPVQKLKIHIIGPEPNEITLENANAVLLCDACFAVCHFEKSVENNYFVLSNSVLSQIEIIELYRQYEGLIQREIDLKRIVLLSKTPQMLLEEMKEEFFKGADRIKLLYTRNFSWKNSK